MFPVSGIAVAVCSMQFATASESEYASDLPVSNDWDPGLSTKMPLEPFERFTALNRSWISYISKESSTIDSLKVFLRLHWAEQFLWRPRPLNMFIESAFEWVCFLILWATENQTHSQKHSKKSASRNVCTDPKPHHGSCTFDSLKRSQSQVKLKPWNLCTSEKWNVISLICWKHFFVFFLDIEEDVEVEEPKVVFRVTFVSFLVSFFGMFFLLTSIKKNFSFSFWLPRFWDVCWDERLERTFAASHTTAACDSWPSVFFG